VTPVCGNEAIADALAREGYRVAEVDGKVWSVAPSRPPLVALPENGPAPAGAPFDLCIVATKATHLAGAVARALPHLAPGAPVVPCQNGLPDDIAAEVAGDDRVLGCIVIFGATMTEAGRYQATSKGTIQVGRPSPRAPDLAPVAGLLELVAPVTVVGDLAGARWSKLAINCATSTIGAIGGARLGPLLRHRFVRRLVLEIWTEIAVVARASSVRLAPLGGTLDIDKLALTPAERRAPIGSPALAWKHSVIVAVGMKYRRMRSSMLIAIERGRTPEIAFLNGEVSRRGAALGIATPVNDQLVATIASIVAGRERPSLPLLKRVYQDVMGVAADAAA
jgi:2-dehydropantoate 2-reductase